MTYEQFTATMLTLKHAKMHICTQRGQGNCQAAIARNRAYVLLSNAEFAVVGEYANGMADRLAETKELASIVRVITGPENKGCAR